LGLDLSLTLHDACHHESKHNVATIRGFLTLLHKFASPDRRDFATIHGLDLGLTLHDACDIYLLEFRARPHLSWFRV
jgi:hypothetical protein